MPNKPMKDGHSTGLIRLSTTLDKQVREIAEQTRQPITQVMNALVLYALDHVVLKPVKVCEMSFREGK